LASRVDEDKDEEAQESKIDSRSMPGEEQLGGSGWCEVATAGTKRGISLFAAL
jgi:hypothetical protein